MTPEQELQVRVGYLRSRLLYLRLPPDLYDDLANLADKNERTIKAAVEALIRDAVQRYREDRS